MDWGVVGGVDNESCRFKRETNGYLLVHIYKASDKNSLMVVMMPTEASEKA